MKKMLAVLALLNLTACATTEPSAWDRAGQRLSQGPDFTPPNLNQQRHSTNGTTISASQYFLPNGTYSVIRSGSTVTVSKSSK
jgi:hypothetical protein